jgi:outer membrane protein
MRCSSVELTIFLKTFAPNINTMKFKSSRIIIALATILILTLAFTKGVTKSKVGHIHTNALWELMPEKKKADTLIAIQRSKMETFYKEKQREFQSKWQTYVKDSASLSGTIKEQRVKEVVDLNKSLESMPKDFDKDLTKLRENKYAPIRKKMQGAVDIVSKANQYDYILDSSYGTIIYTGNDTDNIIDLVKKELKIK